MLEDCCSSVHPVAQHLFLSVPFFSLLCFWLFVLPDSPQSPKLLLSLNSHPPLVQGRLGCSTTGLFVGLGSDACRPECTCLGFFFFFCSVLIRMEERETDTEREIEREYVCYSVLTLGVEGQLTVTSLSRYIHTTVRPSRPSRSGISVTCRRRAPNKRELDLDTHILYTYK